MSTIADDVASSSTSWRGTLLSLDADLVLEREDEGGVADLDPLEGLAAFASNRIGGVEAGGLDQLDAVEALQGRVDLADVRRASEKPAFAVGTTCEREK